MRYDIYLVDHKDGTYDATIRDNKKLKEDKDYTITIYDIDKHSLKLLTKKYHKMKTNYYMV